MNTELLWIKIIFGIISLFFIVFPILYKLLFGIYNRCNNICYSCHIQYYINLLEDLRYNYTWRNFWQVIITIILGILIILCCIVITQNIGIEHSPTNSPTMINQNIRLLNIFPTKHNIYWNKTPIFIVFIILCILLLFEIYNMNKTSHKIKLINSTKVKILSYDSNWHPNNNYNDSERFMQIIGFGKKYIGNKCYLTLNEKLVTDNDNNAIDVQNINHNIDIKIQYNNTNKQWYLINGDNSILIDYYISDELKTKIVLEINRLTLQLNDNLYRDIWKSIFN